MKRHEPDLVAWLQPHVDHFSLIPVLLYQVLLRLVGLRSYLPYLGLTWSLHLAWIWLIFRITARRAGREFWLVAALPQLFLGSGNENLLHAFQTTFLLSEAVAHAQESSSRPRVAFLGAGSPSTNAHFLGAFRQGLCEHGYVDGQNVTIEARWAEGRSERFPDLIDELVRLKAKVYETRLDSTGRSHR